MSITKYMKGIAIALSALTLSSCASDYLDTPTHGSIPADKICVTPENARMAILGVMGRGLACGWTPGNGGLVPSQALMQGETGISYYLGEIPGSDNYVNFIYDQAPSWAIFYNMQDGALITGTYVWNYTIWYYSYAMLAQVNEILAGIDGTDVSAGPDAVALRDFTKAQALTMRAHCYWRLLQTYAPRWVDSNNGATPCVVLRLSPNDPQEKAVSTMGEVIAQCYADLDLAAELFENTKSFRTLNYEVDKNVCYGVYTRIAALKNDWPTVAAMANKARQGKRLATVDEAFSGYISYNTNEWMWSPSFDQIDNWIYGNFCTFFACNGYAAINERYTNSINRDLYRLIPEEDKRCDWWFTYEKAEGLRPNMFYMPTAVNPETGAFKNNRLLSAAVTWLNEHKPSGITGSNAYANATASDKSTAIIRDGAQIKFWCNGETGQNGMCQVPYMRATEMYLYEAEALAELGQTAQAQALLQEINKNFNPTYTCSLTGQALIDEVRLYRRVELWGEGFCWFDLKRWNMPMVRTAWVANDDNSGNIPAGLACDVPVSANYGWRHAIPNTERSYNTLVTEVVPGANTK